MLNSSLNKAKKARNDEFYTVWKDIENEMNAYLEYNPDVFRDKVILLPCDDPTWSNFTKYFISNFDRFGLKKLISTNYQHEGRGKIYTLEANKKENVSTVHSENIAWNYLEGDGDFRSEEVCALRDEADFIITNPPFSLFKEFMKWIYESSVDNVGYCIIGNKNAVTYKEFFPYIKRNEVWLGYGTPSVFRVPFFEDDKDEYKTVPSWWYTNILHGKRNEPLSLMTKKENERFNKKVTGNLYAYKKYDNYDAIEVPATSAIPSDYKGAMGVPISFLTKYNSEQFEILDALIAPLINGKGIYKRIIIRNINLL